MTAPRVDLHRLIFGGLVVAILPSLPGAWSPRRVARGEGGEPVTRPPRAWFVRE